MFSTIVIAIMIKLSVKPIAVKKLSRIYSPLAAGMLITTITIIAIVF